MKGTRRAYPDLDLDAQRGRWHDAPRALRLPCLAACAFSFMSAPASTLRLWFENLNVPGFGETLTLAQLTGEDHIHGGLRLEIGGRLVPHLGHWGPDDVCFNEWLVQLWTVARAFATAGAEPVRHVYDDCEQGQPAFLFEREGERAYFSIIASDIGGGDADPAWQRIEFSPVELIAEQARFQQAFLTELRATAPPAAVEEWLVVYDLASVIGS